MSSGDRVIKEGGDYVFEGIVLSVFKKLSGKVRVAVENKDGLIHIFNPEQLRKIES